MVFKDFEIEPRCLRVLDKQNITEPTPIQEQGIPVALQGGDMIGIAQTGTGKTLAFALPGLTKLVKERMPRNAMLVLVPTRELCVQVHRVFEELGKPLGIHSVPIYGGVSIQRQADQLREGRAVVVATPGRLLDQMGRRNVDFHDLKILVLDEADRMLDMGFLPDIKDIIRKLPKKRQTLAFSATFPDEMARLARSILKDPVRVSVGSTSTPVDSVRQVTYAVHDHDKTRLLLQILDTEEVTSTIIFMRRKDRTEQLARALKSKNHSIAQIHGDRSQIQREQALKGFRSGRYNILCATDVAARGLDIDGVTHVINYDIPPTSDDYIHRIGRTARAQAEGDAITFVAPTDHRELETIERALGRNLPREDWEDAPPVLTLYHPKDSKRARAKRGKRRPARLLRRR